MIITAKYLGPTNTKGARVKVSAQGFKARTYPYLHWGSQSVNFTEAIRDYIGTNEIMVTGNPFVFHETAGGVLAVRSSWVLTPEALESTETPYPL